MKNHLLLIIVLAVCFSSKPAFASYEVKGKCAGASIFYLEGEIEKEPCNDQVIYEVMPEQQKIIRKAVISGGAGLQSDNSEYVIVYDNPTGLIMRNEDAIQQHVIKGFGQVAASGGYEMVVIGDDFITTVKSAMNYLTIYRYERQQ